MTSRSRPTVTIRDLGERVEAKHGRHMIQDGAQKHRCRHVAAIGRSHIDFAA